MDTAMQLMRVLTFLVFLPFTASPAGAAVKTQARLILSAEAARPGETVTAGVLLKMPSGWHTYWKNPGDSGEATKIVWQLPDGIQAGEIQWPVPDKLNVADLTTYIYHDQVLLMAPLTLADNLPAGPKELKAQVSWLECEQLCLPGKGEVKATLEIAPKSKPSAELSLFDAWKKKLPRTDSLVQAGAWWEKEPDGDSRPLIVEVGMKDADDFFAYPGKTFEVQAATEKMSADREKVRLRKIVRKYEGDWPSRLKGIAVGKAGSSVTAVELDATIGLESKAAGVLTSEPRPVTETPNGVPETAVHAPQRSLPLMLFFAFLGGLILNIMPCVLPVIALKVLGFVNQSKESP